ncbi:MAG: hypothetical protein EOO02_22050 [Chitinophagaceae bacterium]|nr:MAG: hypothetical protein EOO02_22050 [Chitinophagaceae bacterium]
MKTKYLYLSLAGVLLFIMCQQPSNNKDTEALMNVTSTKTCYVAADGKDSAFLAINTYADRAVTGQLDILYEDHRNNTGSFTGSFKGDTLFVQYRFQSDKTARTVFTNPLAFLKSGDSLILGTGKIMKNLGRVYLDEKQGLDFEKGRFRFYTIDCKERLLNLSAK